MSAWRRPAVTKRESPLIRRYWERIGGTLMEEYRVGRRRLDAVIIPDGKRELLPRQKHISLDEQDVIVIETKRRRLNRYLAGQSRYARPLGLAILHAKIVAHRGAVPARRP